MRLLPWQDFELLDVDLVFSNSRMAPHGAVAVGKTQRDRRHRADAANDGRKRAFVQTQNLPLENKILTTISNDLKNSDAYDKMFFVWHTDDVGEIDDSNVVLIGPDRLARMVFDAGLASWLREKVS